MRFWPFLQLGKPFLYALGLGLELFQIVFQPGHNFLLRDETALKPHTPMMLMTAATTAAVVPFPAHTVSLMTMMSIPSTATIFTWTLLSFYILLPVMVTMSTTTATFFPVHRIPPYYKSISSYL
jgi:hypothetical protein